MEQTNWGTHTPEYNGVGYGFHNHIPCKYFYVYNPQTWAIDHSKPFLYQLIGQEEYHVSYKEPARNIYKYMDK